MNTNSEFPNLPTADEFHGDNATYRPGGDAQHVSALVREIALDGLLHTDPGNREIAPGVKINTDSEMIKAALETLPSEALKNKFLWAVKNIESGKSRVLRRVGAEQGFKFPRARRAVQETPKTGTVKVGRWEYPTREDEDGNIQRNTKRDGSGDWVDLED